MKNGATKEEFLDYLIFFPLFLCFQIFWVFVFNLLIVASRLTHNILLRHAVSDLEPPRCRCDARAQKHEFEHDRAAAALYCGLRPN